MKKFLGLIIVILILNIMKPSIAANAIISGEICKNEKSLQMLEEQLLDLKDFMIEYEESESKESLMDLMDKLNKNEKALRKIQFNKEGKDAKKNIKKLYSDIKYAVKKKTKHIKYIEGLREKNTCDSTINQRQGWFDSEEIDRIKRITLRFEEIGYNILEVDDSETRWKKSWDDIYLHCHMECIDEAAPIPDGYTITHYTFETVLSFNIDRRIYSEVKNSSQEKLSDDEVEKIALDKYYLSEEEMNKFICENYILWDCELTNNDTYFKKRHKPVASDRQVSYYEFVSKSTGVIYKIEYEYLYDDKNLETHYNNISIFKDILEEKV